MAQIPLFIDGTALRVLVVGGGQVATRKIEQLIDCGARPLVVATRFESETRILLQQAELEFEQRTFVENDLATRNFVVCATDNAALQRSVSRACQERGIPVNVVDDRTLSTVTFPSVVVRTPVKIAISTDGASPVLATRLRAKIERLLPASLGQFADFLAERRTRVKATLPTVEARRALWTKVVESDIPELIARAKHSQAASLFDDMLAGDETATGSVSLVGAGPGDPELLTLKALRCIENADVVYYDNLVSDGVLQHARREARMIYVGKRKRFATVRQEKINEMLLADAVRGMKVVRLKGGDPFLFGRGGEEIETLAANGVAFEVVPGITAALGCAAYAGIPLTHRDLAQSVRFVTGHLQNDEVNLDWPELVKTGQTLVIYMGLVGLPRLTANLLENGMDAATPAAVVSRATYPDQHVVRGTVQDISAKVLDEQIPGPTTTIIGAVAGIRTMESRT